MANLLAGLSQQIVQQLTNVIDQRVRNEDQVSEINRRQNVEQYVDNQRLVQAQQESHQLQQNQDVDEDFINLTRRRFKNVIVSATGTPSELQQLVRISDLIYSQIASAQEEAFLANEIKFKLAQINDYNLDPIMRLENYPGIRQNIQALINKDNSWSSMDLRLEELRQLPAESMSEYVQKTKALYRDFISLYGNSANAAIREKTSRDVAKQFMKNTKNRKVREALIMRGIEGDLESCTLAAMQQEVLQKSHEFDSELVCGFCQSKGHRLRDCNQRERAIRESNILSTDQTARCAGCDTIGHTISVCKVIKRITNNDSGHNNNQNPNQTNNRNLDQGNQRNNRRFREDSAPSRPRYNQPNDNRGNWPQQHNNNNSARNLFDSFMSSFQQPVNQRDSRSFNQPINQPFIQQNPFNQQTPSNYSFNQPRQNFNRQQQLPYNRQQQSFNQQQQSYLPVDTVNPSYQYQPNSNWNQYNRRPFNHQQTQQSQGSNYRGFRQNQSNYANNQANSSIQQPPPQANDPPSQTSNQSFNMQQSTPIPPNQRQVRTIFFDDASNTSIDPTFTPTFNSTHQPENYQG